MEALIRDLLKQLGAELAPAPAHNPIAGVTLLGVLAQPVRVKAGPHVPVGTWMWHAQDGWSDLDRMELERFLVDAPAGTHWLLSERKLAYGSQMPQREGVDLQVWGPDDFATWLGRAVLNGDLSAQIPQAAPVIEMHSEIGAESSPTVRDERLPAGGAPFALAPRVEVAHALQAAGVAGAEHRPVLLSARAWSVTGTLRGPDDASERQWWTLIEDPFSGQIDALGNAKLLEFIPNLARLDPPRWADESVIRQSLPGLCDTRRHHAAPGAMASLLQWWRLDPSSAELDARLALIPAWQVRIPGRGWALLHGLSGQLLPMPQASG